MGAGLAGVTTAWYLARDGHEVAVIDREPEAGAGASATNTGIIAASRAYPWSSGEIGRALRRSALRFDAELWLWGIQHLLLRSGRSYRKVLDAKVRLVRYSQQVLHALAAEIEFPGFRHGVLYAYRDKPALERVRDVREATDVRCASRSATVDLVVHRRRAAETLASGTRTSSM